MFQVPLSRVCKGQIIALGADVTVFRLGITARGTIHKSARNGVRLQYDPLTETESAEATGRGDIHSTAKHFTLKILP